MSNVIIFGGTKFFGIDLVEKMLASGHVVTIVSRVERLPKLLQGRVTHIREDLNLQMDVTSAAQSARIAKLFLDSEFDIIIDNISWQVGEVEGITAALKSSGRTIEQYILCSSVAVYNLWNKGRTIADWSSDALKEEEADLNQVNYSPEVFSPTFSGFYRFYANGKRTVERELLVASSQQRFAYTIMRPVVIEGANDPHNRTWYWVQRLLDKKPILIPSEDTMTTYRHVHASDVAQAFSSAVGNHKAFNQTFNIAGEEILTVEEYVLKVADALGISRVEVLLVPISPEMAADKISGFEFPPFFSGVAFVSDIAKAKERLGYSPKTIDDWMMATINRLLESQTILPNSLGYEKRAQEVALAEDILVQ